MSTINNTKCKCVYCEKYCETAITCDGCHTKACDSCKQGHILRKCIFCHEWFCKNCCDQNPLLEVICQFVDIPEGNYVNRPVCGRHDRSIYHDYEWYYDTDPSPVQSIPVESLPRPLTWSELKQISPEEKKKLKLADKKLYGYRSHLYRLGSDWICGDCGHQLHSDFSYCPSCGSAKINQTTPKCPPHPFPEFPYCAYCGIRQEMSETANVQSSPHSQAEAQVQAQPQAEAQPQPQAEAQPQAQAEAQPSLDNECVVCLEEKEQKWALVDCGHTSTCFTCINELQDKKCPICRAPITNFIKIFS